MIEKKYIAPNAITAVNMLLGYLSIINSIDGKFVTAVWFIIGAMICDTLDGKAARKFDAFSEFGKEFDSFSDAISFGLAPGILIYSVLLKRTGLDSGMAKLIIPISFIYSLCVVMRLVKFNIVTVASTEKDDFSGMPSPCGAAIVIGYYLICDSIRNASWFGGLDLYSNEMFSVVAIASAILMVSTIPFKTADKIFVFIPKKFFPLFVLIVLLTMKYSLFIFSLFYILANLKDYIMTKGLFFKTEERENKEIKK